MARPKPTPARPKPGPWLPKPKPGPKAKPFGFRWLFAAYAVAEFTIAIRKGQTL